MEYRLRMSKDRAPYIFAEAIDVLRHSSERSWDDVTGRLDDLVATALEEKREAIKRRDEAIADICRMEVEWVAVHDMSEHIKLLPTWEYGVENNE